MFFLERTEIKNILQSDFRRRAGKYVQIRAEDGTIFYTFTLDKREKDGLLYHFTDDETLKVVMV